MIVKPTQFQRVHLFLWDYQAAADPWLVKLYQAGSRVLNVHLQDSGEVPRSKVDGWKNIIKQGEGFKVWGIVRPSGPPLHPHGVVWSAQEVRDFAFAEKRRLGLNGMRFNFEDDVEQLDFESEGRWSGEFTSGWRLDCPALPSILDTYFGSRGMNLDAYRRKDFRLSIQTYNEWTLWADPPQAAVTWAAARGWLKSRVKITLPVMKKDEQRMPADQMVEACMAARTVGACLYYVDGAFDVLDEYLVPLTRDLIAKGAAA